MNILFYTNQYPDYLLVGIERITSRLTLSLRNKRFHVYNLFIQEYFPRETIIKLFDDVKYISAKDILSREDEAVFALDARIQVYDLDIDYSGANKQNVINKHFVKR